MDSTTSETIARTIDEFSFIFTGAGLPPRLSSFLLPHPVPVPHTPPSVCSSSYHYYHRTQQDYSEGGDMPRTNFYDTYSYPLPFPKRTCPSSPSSSSSSSSSLDDLLLLLHLSPTIATTSTTTTTTTETKTAFDRCNDIHSFDGRSAISSFPSSSFPSYPRMPPPHLPPRPSSPTTTATTNVNTHQQRSSMYYYTKLPHFHPPRFSRRLRNLIAERRRPVRLRLVAPCPPPSRERRLPRPPLDEEKGQEGPYWVISTSPDVGESSPTTDMTAGKRRLYIRLVLVVALAGIVGGIIVLALSMTVGWR